MLAARAARLFFTIQPIKFLIGGVVMADDVSMLTLPNLAAMTSFPTTEVTEFLRLGTNQNNIAQTLKKKKLEKVGKLRYIYLSTVCIPRNSVTRYNSGHQDQYFMD